MKNSTQDLILFQPAQLDEEIHFFYLKIKKQENVSKKFGKQKKMYYLCIINEKKDMKIAKNDFFS